MTAIMLRRKGLGSGSCKGISEKSEEGIKVIRNWLDTDWFADWPSGQFPIVFRWGCTSNLGLDRNSYVVVNEAKAIHWCTDKRASRLAMQDAGISVPTTWGSYQELGYDYWDSELPLNVKIVLRPSRHAQGKDLNVYVTDEEEQLVAKCKEYGQGNYYLSKFVDKVAEYRVYVVQGRCVGVGNKTPADPTSIAWNMAQGGSFANVKWSQWNRDVVTVALEATKLSGLDFAGVDVMVDAAGKVYVLELNSAPTLGPYMQGVFAKAFDYIIANGKETIPCQGASSWKDVIHPAIWSG